MDTNTLAYVLGFACPKCGRAAHCDCQDLRTFCENDNLKEPHYERVLVALNAAVDEIDRLRLNAVDDDPSGATQSCGCVYCVCEDIAQCHGCGARFCDRHKAESKARQEKAKQLQE